MIGKSESGNTMSSRTIKFPGGKLLLFKVYGEETIGCAELGAQLQYAEPSRLRRLITKTWTLEFQEEKDYFFVEDLALLKKYSKRTPNKDHLFLTSKGVAKVLDHTTKKAKVVIYKALHKAGFLSPFHKNSKIIKAQRKTSYQSTPEKQRIHTYEVLQTLIKQLSTLTEPVLIYLAIESAEIALGHTLPDVREKFKKQTISGYPKFTEPGFYSLKQIGEKAGGYSAHSAGMAASKVAISQGTNAYAIRHKKLPFNMFEKVPDSTGKLRKRVKFNRDFSNAVIGELRKNTRFRPVAPKNVITPTFSPTENTTNYPNLTQDLNWAELLSQGNN